MGEDLTKVPLPLIIIVVRMNNLTTGVGGLTESVSATQWRLLMKVSVYKDDKGDLSVLVQASPGKGRAPVLLKGITLENIREQVLPVVTAMRRPRGVPAG